MHTYSDTIIKYVGKTISDAMDTGQKQQQQWQQNIDEINYTKRFE